MKDFELLKKKIVKVLKENGVVRAGIFGSYARGEQKRGSDIDILIEVENNNFNLYDLVGLKFELERILKRKVDLTTYKSLNKLLKKQILLEEKKLI